MKKTILLLSYGLFFVSTILYSNELSYTRKKTASLDIELSGVNLIIAPSKKKSIAYRFELTEGKHLSCIETNHTLRIREILPVKGNLYVFVPEKLLLESCIIRSSSASVTITELQAVHFLLMMNNGFVTLSKDTLKNAVINVARSNLIFDGEIIRSCAFCASSSTANIKMTGNSTCYNLDYVHSNSSFTIDANAIAKIKTQGVYGNPKAKRRIIFSAGSSNVSIQFSDQEKAK